MADKHTGFQDYVDTGKFTPQFINDYQYWCKRIFRQWSLFVDFDTFYSICWEALLSKINEFDPKIATIQTFCISRINNEAWRLYMKNKTRRPEIDSDSAVIANTLEATKVDNDLFEQFYSFQLYANSLGVQVDLKAFYDQYSSGQKTPAMIAFLSWRVHNKQLEGRNDLQKRQRQANGNASCKK